MLARIALPFLFHHHCNPATRNFVEKFYLMSFHMGQMMGQLELNVLAEDQIMTAPQWIRVNISYKGRRA